MDKETLARIEKDLTDEKIERLTQYAIKLARAKVWWRHAGGEILPEGESPETIVSRVLEKLIDGSNTWPYERVSLYTFLKRNIQREIGHLATCKENKSKRMLTELEDEDPELSELRWQTILAFSEIGKALDPREEAIRKQEDEKCQELLDELYYSLQSDEVAAKVVESLLDGRKPREIAEQLGIEKNEVYNAQRLIRRLLKKVMKARNAQKRSKTSINKSKKEI